MVSRGKPSQAVAGLRPLHGFTYRFRNARRSRSYGADEQLYEMLSHASPRSSTASRSAASRTSSSPAWTRAPRRRASATEIDVETQALISLSEAVRGQITDRPVTDRDRRSYPPLYQEAADLLADDVLRLLSHRHLIPRTVLVDYLKILFAFHLALYHLKIMKLLPAMVRGDKNASAGRRVLPRRHRPAGSAVRPGSPSGAPPPWFGRIPEFVRATFTVKKLDDLGGAPGQARPAQPAARWLLRGERPAGPARPALSQGAHHVRGWAADRDRGAADPRMRTRIPPYAQLLQLGLDEFTTYVEVVTHYRVKFHRQYLTECLDTLLLKNRPGAMIAQPRSGTAPLHPRQPPA